MCDLLSLQANLTLKSLFHKRDPGDRVISSHYIIIYLLTYFRSCILLEEPPIVQPL
jgi:hypothetical protein